MRASIKRFVSDYGFALATAAVFFAIHLVANRQYGFHRDELQFIADSRHPSFGFVAYPPFTALIGYLSRVFFGESLAGYRALSSLSYAAIVFVAGLMARELGGKGFARGLSALACAAAPVLQFSGSVLMYMIFDSLWWVLTAYFVLRVLRGNERSWIGVGLAVGLGMMTKYSMAFLVAAMVLAIVILPERSVFLSRYFLAALAIALCIFLPNLAWLARNDFITYDFLAHIHARDIAWGRTEGFFLDQLSDCLGFGAVPIAIAGAVFIARSRDMRRFRPALVWVAACVAIFALMRGRGYYTAALYVPLTAGGAVWLERAVEGRRFRAAFATAAIAFYAAYGLATSAAALPLAPAGSAWFDVIVGLNGNYVEQFGWEELAHDVAQVRDSLPESERATFGILAGNYGEAGALEYYGRRYGLGKVMCGTNSFYDRGYDESEPRTVVVVGFDREFVSRMFESYEVVAKSRNALGLRNEEAVYHREIFLCRGPRMTWREFWKGNRRFG